MKQKKVVTLLEIMVNILLGVGVLFLLPYQARIPAHVIGEVINPQMFPKLCAWALAMVGVLRLFLFLKEKEKSDTRNGGQIDIVHLLLGAAVIFAYVLLMPFLGYIITTIISIFILIYLLGRPQWHKALLCAMVATVIIWTVFDKFLHVPLPSGFVGI